MLERLRQTCNGQRDFIARQADQIRELTSNFRDVAVSSQRQVYSPYIFTLSVLQMLILLPSIVQACHM